MKNSHSSSDTILLISIENINNAGDELLRITTGFLVDKVGKELNKDYRIERMQFFPFKDDLPLAFKPDYYIGSIIKTLSRRFKGSDREYSLLDIAFKVQYSRYYSSFIKKASKIIFTIGMLKYSTQYCSFFFHLINSIANKYWKPVLMNALSIEKASPEDWRYRQLVDAVAFPCVRAVTTRDGSEGLRRLKMDYIKDKNVTADYVGDPALWVPECFNVVRRTPIASTEGDKRLIGIGLVRKGIFKLYHKDFSKDQVEDLYIRVISEVKKRGYDYFLFCNGIRSDYLFGQELVSKYGLPSEKLCPPPHSGKELIDILSRCDAVLGVRLHACVCSVALGVPVAGLIWDEKIESFSETMGIRQLFSTVEEFDEKLIVDKIESAMRPDSAIGTDTLSLYKEKTHYYIKSFLRDELR